MTVIPALHPDQVPLPIELTNTCRWCLKTFSSTRARAGHESKCPNRHSRSTPTDLRAYYRTPGTRGEE